MGRLGLLLCCPLLILRGIAAEDTEATFSKVREQMAINLARVPNYTCTQTTERLERMQPSKRLRVRDLVRLEVALVEGRELFAWPGSLQFSDKELRHLVGTGMSGNGQFALMAKIIFQTRLPVFTYAGETYVSGRRLLKWDFSVARDTSPYTLRVDEKVGTAGLRGSFWADGKTLDVASLDVSAESIPDYLGLTAARMQIRYSPVMIGSREFLLPSSSELEMETLGGNLATNRTLFERCRQYTGESRVIFEDDPETAEGGAAAKAIWQLGAGVQLHMALGEPIRDTAAAGDPIKAVLQKAVKVGELTIPKGAEVVGRLLAVRGQAMSTGFMLYTIAMEFERMEWKGNIANFSAEFEAVPVLNSPAGVFGPAPGPFRNSGFSVDTRVLHLPKGLPMRWRTKAPPIVEKVN